MYGIKLEIIIFLLLIRIIAELCIDGLHLNFDNFLQVSGSPQLLIVDLRALFVLG
jgi:hypothetical protein